MTLEQLETLLKRAEDVLGCRVSLGRRYNGNYSLLKEGGDSELNVRDTTRDECIAKLKQWATPPKPDMLTVLVPIATAEFAAAFNAPGLSEAAVHSRAISKACLEALAPYQQPE